MGIVERKQRLREETRVNILGASLQIVKQEGWKSLSMRKIADMIEYTAPIIYDYFSSKEALLMEMTRRGFLLLNDSLMKDLNAETNPAELVEIMWLKYWDFAFKEKEYYQLMFGVDTPCCINAGKIPESKIPAKLFKEAIKGLYKGNPPSETELSSWYYTYWSVVHGLISIIMVTGRSPETVNKHILIQSIYAVGKSIAEAKEQASEEPVE